MSSKIPVQDYDELLLLARDARQRRRRTNIVTTAAVTAAMAISAGYVVSVNQPAEQGNAERGDAPGTTSQLPTINIRPVFEIGTESAGGATGQAAPGDQLGGIGEGADSEQAGQTDRDIQTAQERQTPQGAGPAAAAAGTGQVRYYRELIWLVEGSRRIPMTVGDVAWIPEVNRRVRVQAIDPSDVSGVADRRFVTVTLDVLPDGVTGLDTDVLETVQLRGAQPSEPMLNTTDDVGNASCVIFEQLGESTRRGFTDGRFIDLDIRFVAERC